jgi:hypothetical protein
MNPSPALMLFRGALSPALGAGIFGILMLVIVALYVYMALCTHLIAKKTNTEDDWWAWIPILNFLLLCKIARKPLWWVLLMFVPLVNIVIVILIWVGVCEARGKSGALVIGLFLPVVNLAVIGYLAFAD